MKVLLVIMLLCVGSVIATESPALLEVDASVDATTESIMSLHAEATELSEVADQQRIEFEDALIELQQHLQYDLSPGDVETADAAIMRLAADPAFIDIVDHSEGDDAEAEAEDSMNENIDDASQSQLATGERSEGKGPIWNAVKSGVKGVGKAVVNGVKGVGKAIVNGVKGAATGVKNLVKGAWNKAKSIGSKVKKAVFGTKKTLKQVPAAVKPVVAVKPVAPAAKQPAKPAASKKFKPKTSSLTGGANPLRKALNHILTEEPDSAAVKKAKDNWKWEDIVLRRLDTYAPPDPRQLKKRLEKVEDASGETCVKADDTCIQYPINMNSCLIAKQACFESKVTVIRLKKASDVCVAAEEPCQRHDWKGKGDCLVAKARCKKHLQFTAHSAIQAKKLSRTLRNLEIYDKEAQMARVNAKDGKLPVKAAKKAQKAAEKFVKKCVLHRTAAQKCEAADDDVTPKCVKSLKLAEGCVGAEDKVQEAKDLVEDMEKALAELITEKNAREHEAKQG